VGSGMTVNVMIGPLERLLLTSG